MKINKQRLALALGLSAFALDGCQLHSTSSSSAPVPVAEQATTTTPIKHVVVIFQENVSFDHYFGTYPVAANLAGEPPFTAVTGTPTVNGTPGSSNYVNALTPALLNKNPNNANPKNGTGNFNPFRLDLAQAATNDQNHAYPAEQGAFDNGLMDLFPYFTGSVASGGVTTNQVMGYYDGNTVTALWNYAQHYAMNDNSYSSTFGPSSVGAINLVSGQTNGAVPGPGTTAAADGTYDEYTDANGNTAATLVPDGQGGYTDVDDDDPVGDVCSSSTGFKFSMTGKNIGDLLNSANVTWGWFQGGFDLTQTNPNGTTGCNLSTWSNITKSASKDYVPHHAAFQYYASTANPNHTRPSSVAAIGTSNDGGANHQYDLHDFYSVLAANNLPSVTFLKAPRIGQGHAGYSDPIDEQNFLTTAVNAIEQSSAWKDTVIIIAYDDSDGWYDHAYPTITNGSQLSVVGYDRLGDCVKSAPTLNGVNGKPVNGRCGPGTRQPLLVISPYAKVNYVDHTTTNQTSIIRFIEDNWLNGTRIAGSFDATAGVLTNMFNFSGTPNTTPYVLDTTTGVPVTTP